MTGSRRIGYVTASFPFGRSEPFLAPEVRELARRGVDLTLVPVRPRGRVPTSEVAATATVLRHGPAAPTILRSAARRAARQSGAVVRAARWSLQVHGWRNRLLNLAVLPKALWFAGEIEARGIQHVHVHWAGPPATMGKIAADLAGVPWSLTAHYRDIQVNNHLADKLTSAGFVRFISHEMRAVAASVSGQRTDGCSVVHVGIDVPSARAAPTAGDALRILVPARLDPVKRQDLLLEAVADLAATGVAVQVDLAGAGSCEQALRSEVERRGLGAQVRFLGHVPHEALLERYRSGQVDVVVLTSDGEGIPVALMEALAHYVPVVATDVGGVAELLHEGCGVLVAPGDAGAVRDALARMAGDHPWRAALALGGRRRVEQAFDVRGTTDELLVLIDGRAEGS